MMTVLQITVCPECSGAAEILNRGVLDSTHGPVEHARVQCPTGHVFNLPVAMLSPDAVPHPTSGRDVDSQGGFWRSPSDEAARLR